MTPEFEHLLESWWAGELDAEGLARLEALAASDPELAEIWQQEQKLTGLLTVRGGERAPAGLAESIIARLEADSKSGVSAEVVDPRTPAGPAAYSLNTSKGKRGARKFWGIPVVRMAVAASVACIVIVQAVRMGDEDLGVSRSSSLVERKDQLFTPVGGPAISSDLSSVLEQNAGSASEDFGSLGDAIAGAEEAGVGQSTPALGLPSNQRLDIDGDSGDLMRRATNNSDLERRIEEGTAGDSTSATESDPIGLPVAPAPAPSFYAAEPNAARKLAAEPPQMSGESLFREGEPETERISGRPATPPESDVQWAYDANGTRDWATNSIAPLMVPSSEPSVHRELAADQELSTRLASGGTDVYFSTPSQSATDGHLALFYMIDHTTAPLDIYIQQVMPTGINQPVQTAALESTEIMNATELSRLVVDNGGVISPPQRSNYRQSRAVQINGQLSLNQVSALTEDLRRRGVQLDWSRLEPPAVGIDSKTLDAPSTASAQAPMRQTLSLENNLFIARQVFDIHRQQSEIRMQATLRDRAGVRIENPDQPVPVRFYLEVPSEEAWSLVE